MSLAMPLIIRILLYALLLFGIVLTFAESIKCRYLELAMRKRLRLRRRQEKPEKTLQRHLRKTIYTVLGEKISPNIFIAVCVIIFLLVLLPTINYYGCFVALMSALLMASFPYLFLRTRLENMRKKVSFEGEEFLGEFLSNYRISACDVLEAMARVSLTDRPKEQLKLLLSKMLYAVRNDSSTSSIRNAEEQFSFAVNSNWAKMFSYNLGIAITTGEDISLALEDILIQLREARVLGEKRKRLNAEATKMVLFLVPAMYLMTVITSVYFIGLSWQEFFHHQFMTSQGFLLFLLGLIFFLINLILTEVVNHQRFDF